jgi:predicted DNA-binding transcriptional regulator AlpA
MTLPDKDFYRVKEICAALNISRVGLWKRIRKGAAPALEHKSPRVAGYSRETLRQLQSNG